MVCFSRILFASLAIAWQNARQTLNVLQNQVRAHSLQQRIQASIIIIHHTVVQVWSMVGMLSTIVQTWQIDAANFVSPQISRLIQQKHCASRSQCGCADVHVSGPKTVATSTFGFN